MSIKERLKDYCAAKKISVAAFEREAGLSNGYFNQIKVRPSTDKLQKIAKKFPNLNTDWLITGSGDMIKDNPPLVTSIPLIPLEAAAGALRGNGDSIMAYQCDYVVPMFKSAEFLIHVSGDSMEPKFVSGDVVACKRLCLDTFFQWGKVYVIDTEQGVVIKRVKKGSDNEHVSLSSENPSYEDFEIERAQIYSIALVLGVIRAM